MLIIANGYLYAPEHLSDFNRSTSLSIPASADMGKGKVYSKEESSLAAYALKKQPDDLFYHSPIVRDHGNGCLTAIDFDEGNWTESTIDGVFSVVGNSRLRSMTVGLWLEYGGDIEKVIRAISETYSEYADYVVWYRFKLVSFGGGEVEPVQFYKRGYTDGKSAKRTK